jgi:NAD(P)-dependent dehydrogenase (short-subunit alcohol dehydrogenase family)
MNRFDGHCVVITGGASGIGEATARAIVKEGGKVLIADLQEDRGRALAEELGAAAIFQKTDVTVESDIATAIERAEKELGPLTGLVNSAGIIGAVGSICDTTVEAYDRTMAIHVRAAFLTIKHAARMMKLRRKGSIVSLTSTAGLLGGLGPHAYTVAKHAIIGLTKSAASELSAHGIRINAVAPAGTVTPMTTALAGGNTKAITKGIADSSPLGFALYPEDVANGILYLLSEDARYVTGHTLAIDAGITSFGREAQGFHNGPSQVLSSPGQSVKD